MKVHIQIDHEMQVAPSKGRGNKRNEMLHSSYITVACQCGKVFFNELDYQVWDVGIFYLCYFIRYVNDILPT